MSGTFNSSHWSLNVTEPSEFTCVVTMRMSGTMYLVHTDLVLEPSQISLSRSVDDTCYSVNSTLNTCNIGLKIKDVRFEPSFLFSIFVGLFKRTIERQVNNFVCSSGMKTLQDELHNHTLALPKPFPRLASNATPLEGSMLFRTLVKVIDKAPPILGVRFGASLHASTTLHLNLEFTNSFNFELDNFDKLQSSVEKVAGMLNMSGLGNFTGFLFNRLPVIKSPFIGINIPQPFSVSLEVSFNDFQCDAVGFNCSVPRYGGIILENIRTENLGEWDRLIVNNLGPRVTPMMNHAIEEALGYMNVTGPRFYIPVMELADAHTVPPTPLLVCMIIVVVILIAVTAGHAIWRYQRTSVTTKEGVKVSLKRVLIEDLLLMGMCALAAFGFAWSNSTTAAALILADEMRIMSFSLMESTMNMLDAGMYVFAVLAFLFSGVYPYIKLVVIIVCTLILQKPDLVLLRVIDYFGKFSFLDSYAMLIMAAGLQIEGIAEVEILPGFYAFLSSTILSILVGNYATTVWRRNTSLRVNSKKKGPFDPETPVLVVEGEGDNQEIKRKKDTKWKRRLFLRIFNFVFIAGCIIPAWVLPCIRYSVTGLASDIQPDGREISLLELGKTNWLFLLTCILTIGIAPVVYAVMYPRCSFFAPWSAAEALLLACVAGLLQLGQFVDYMLGSNMGAFYSARANLLWPLLLLLLGSMWQWLLAAEHRFGITERVGRSFAKRKLSLPAEA
ncbi:uncharacterized protein TM35_000721010 [Trypanosoma theileri]|uniref:Paraquat-inducible protein A n=1 Tax=Trypanosoma theileri TaxID=67003 RepID=A0A1X0NFV0_9TRYP|nr:uncharacterized protein TM35_000721010 [Trypanosoma theileri]ORC83398.1 hypothetical protein TM35_000721010 [Trypanosoma theileri]